MRTARFSTSAVIYAVKQLQMGIPIKETACPSDHDTDPGTGLPRRWSSRLVRDVRPDLGAMAVVQLIRARISEKVRLLTNRCRRPDGAGHRRLLGSVFERKAA